MQDEQQHQQQPSAERATAGAAGSGRHDGRDDASASDGAPSATRASMPGRGGSSKGRNEDNPSPRLSSCSSSGLEGKSEESEIHHYAQAVRGRERESEELYDACS